MMDPYTLILFLGLTVAGGLIAFMGDRLGRYLGKRRVTIFGLRPRKTALLFTVVAGMLIAVTSLGTMSVLDRNVYRAVFQVGELVRSRAALKEENSRLGADTARLLAEASEAKTRAQQARSEEKRSREQLRQTLARLERAEKDAERQIASLQREVRARSRAAAERSRQVASLGTRLDAAQAELKDVAEHLEEARSRRETAEAGFKAAVVRRDEIEKRYRNVETDLTGAQSDLSAARRDVADVNAQRDELQRQVTDLEARAQTSQGQTDSLTQAKAELEHARDSLVVSRDLLQASVTYLGKEKTRLAHERNQLQDEADALRDSEVIFAMGDELGWDVVDGREPRARIRERLEALVERARAVAVAEGERAHAVAVAEGAGPTAAPELALQVVREAEIGPDGRRRRFVDGEALDVVAEEISRANVGVVAQITVRKNAVAGETVVGYINTFTNRLVFHEGERIAAATLDARRPLGEVIEDVVALLQGEVRATAVRRGMIPRLGVARALASPTEVGGTALASERPDGPVAPGTRGRPIGEVPLADVIAAAERARKHRGKTLVEVLAGGDLWTADSMKVAFRVSPLASPSPPRPSTGILGIR